MARVRDMLLALIQLQAALAKFLADFAPLSVGQSRPMIECAGC